LSQTDGRLQIGQPKIETEFFMIEPSLRLKGEVAVRARLFSESLVVGYDHAALSRRNQLVCIETEATHASEAAAPLPRGLGRIPFREIFRPMNFCGVFDDRQAMLFRDAEDGIHIHWMSIDVDGHDGSCTGSNLLLDLRDVHAPRLGIAIDEDRDTAAIDHCQCTRDYREGGEDDFIARFEFQTVDGDLEGRGAIADGDAVLPPAIRRPLLLKFIDKSACGGNPAGANAFEKILGFLWPQERLVDRYHG